MSGGSMNYIYTKVEGIEFDLSTPERRAFAAHLKLVARALHDIEWVDSADYSEGDETAAIRAVLHPSAVLAQLVTEARTTVEELRAEIYRASN